jgi:hypothetical protein
MKGIWKRDRSAPNPRRTEKIYVPRCSCLLSPAHRGTSEAGVDLAEGDHTVRQRPIHFLEPQIPEFLGSKPPLDFATKGLLTSKLRWRTISDKPCGHPSRSHPSRRRHLGANKLTVPAALYGWLATRTVFGWAGTVH